MNTIKSRVTVVRDFTKKESAHLIWDVPVPELLLVVSISI